MIWALCGGWILLLPGLWLLHRLLGRSLTLGTDGITTRRIWRTQSIRWSEIRAFEADARAAYVLTRRNERIRLIAATSWTPSSELGRIVPAFEQLLDDRHPAPFDRVLVGAR